MKIPDCPGCSSQVSPLQAGSVCSSLDQLLVLPGEDAGLLGSEAAVAPGRRRSGDRRAAEELASIPDNFSDLPMSACLSSGRASPALLSGRDTPLSHNQVLDSEE